jgi:NADH-quinone oxidoreductase subunit J
MQTDQLGIFLILALITTVGAVGAVSLRNLVHCALSLTVAFAGLAALYLQLRAQFIGLSQILVYVGAVAILIVFAILLTRGSEAPEKSIVSSSWFVGVGIAAAVFAIFAAVIIRSALTHQKLPAATDIPIRTLGDQLMTNYLLPLEVIGVLLTAALIGAVIIAMNDNIQKTKEPAS